MNKSRVDQLADEREIPSESQRLSNRRQWRHGQGILRLIARGLAALLLATLILVGISPDLRAGMVHPIGEISRILMGLSSEPGGFTIFTPQPPFTVKQPSSLSDDWQPVAIRYAIRSNQLGVANSPGANPVSDLSVTGPAGQAVARDRSNETYIAMGYEAAARRYFALFERAAQPSEPLPAGEPRTINDQHAILRRDRQILTLTWVSDGTWIELEGNLAEAELLEVAAGLVTSQTPDATTLDGAPSGMQMTEHEIPQISLAEAQKQISFHIPVFTWLPPGLKLGGAHVVPPDWVNVFYIPADPTLVAAHGGMGISITRGTDTTKWDIAGTKSQPDIVIHGQPSKYVVGPSVGGLTWEANGFTYRLMYSGLDLSREDMQRLAESLR